MIKVKFSVTRRQLPTKQNDLWAPASRLVLILLVVLIVVTPVTQGIWSNDNFLHGQDDTEYSLFAALAFISLSLLICRHRQSTIDWILSSIQDLLAIFPRSLWDQGWSAALERVRLAFTYGRIRPSEASAYQLPLLI